jgi:hypothetical protein
MTEEPSYSVPGFSLFAVSCGIQLFLFAHGPMDGSSLGYLLGYSS